MVFLVEESKLELSFDVELMAKRGILYLFVSSLKIRSLFLSYLKSSRPSGMEKKMTVRLREVESMSKS